MYYVSTREIIQMDDGFLKLGAMRVNTVNECTNEVRIFHFLPTIGNY